MLLVQADTGADKALHRPDVTAQPRDWVLAALRGGSARAKLIGLILDEIGVSVQHRMIDAATAVAMVIEEGLADWLPQASKPAVN